MINTCKKLKSLRLIVVLLIVLVNAFVTFAIPKILGISLGDDLIRFIGASIGLLIALIIFELADYIIKSDPKSKEKDRLIMMGITYLIIAYVTILSAYYEYGLIRLKMDSAYNASLNLISVSLIVIAILFMGISIACARLKQNTVWGYRNSYTLKSKDTWNKVNKLASVLSFIVAAVLIVMSIVMANIYAYPVFLAMILIEILICNAYSARVYKEEMQKKRV
ncbi:SdpI family protein [Lachnospira pectinoschiza]|uniref:SdpI/YhfL protein family protein n=1 Tax=Lachnospira pectinoschiza TaxID=28052 RepID=A0A1G9ZME3_9FIRM|nr:SdpI family protein [Lachnospira pectinoschiza]SDN22549.1 SdpI/YhfL protein family protein [Lachnospira pectinoschiza]